jgi:hypothetical protein
VPNVVYCMLHKIKRTHVALEILQSDDLTVMDCVESHSGEELPIATLLPS